MGDSPFNINIDPEAVTKAISDAVLASTLGVEIKKSVDVQVEKLGKGWEFKNHIDTVVKQEMSNYIQKIIRENEPVIKTFVEKNLTEKIMEDILRKMWEKWERNY